MAKKTAAAEAAAAVVAAEVASNLSSLLSAADDGRSVSTFLKMMDLSVVAIVAISQKSKDRENRDEFKFIS